MSGLGLSRLEGWGGIFTEAGGKSPGALQTEP